MTLDTLEPTVAADVASTNGQARDFAAMIARAKAILAGQLRPAPLETPAIVRDFLHRELADRQPPPTAAAIHSLTEWLNLQAHFPGTVVAVTTTADDTFAVLAVGEDEIRALYQALTPAEGADVDMLDTPPLD